MVTEINLTSQLEQSLRARLAGLAGADALAVMQSGLADGERLGAWLRIQRGQARVLLGTRLAILAPIPQLGLIIVDEEHDTSYKQQDGLRSSARDLAVWRARDLYIPAVLGSADRKITRLNSNHKCAYRIPSSSRQKKSYELTNNTTRPPLQHT